MQVESTKKSPGTLSESLRARRAMPCETKTVTGEIARRKHSNSYGVDTSPSRRAPLDECRGRAGVPGWGLQRQALDRRGGAGVGADAGRAPALHVEVAPP